MGTVKVIPKGTRFGKLVTLEPSGGINHPVKCQCDCGRTKTIPKSEYLTRKGRGTMSCGSSTCNGHQTHGATHTTEYSIWRDMKDRCYRSAKKSFNCYGGRGISVCKAWRDSFEAFLADMGPRPSMAHSLDRINNDGNYEPGNCRWATKRVQTRNTRRNRYLEANGERRLMVEWAEITGIKQNTILCRLRKGWTEAAAVSTPVYRPEELTHCKRAQHPFTPENTIIAPNGLRRCRECYREWDRNRRKRERGRSEPARAT